MKQKQLLALLLTGAVSFASVPVTAAAQSDPVAAGSSVTEEDSSLGEILAAETEEDMIDTEPVDSETPSDVPEDDGNSETEPSVTPQPTETSDQDANSMDSDEQTPEDENMADAPQENVISDISEQFLTGEEDTEVPLDDEIEKTVVTTAKELQKAIDESTGTKEKPQVIYLKGKQYSNSDRYYMLISNTIVVNDKYVKLVSTESLDLMRSQSSAGDMFQLIGGSLEFDVEKDMSLTVYGKYGTKDYNVYDGSIVHIDDGTFTMNSGVALKNNFSSFHGAGIYNSETGVVVLNGGTISGNRVYHLKDKKYRGGGIGSYGKVVLGGTVDVKNNGLVTKNFSDIAASKINELENIFINCKTGGYLEISSTLTNSNVGFTVYKYKAGTQVIKAASGKVNLSKSIETNGTRQLIYDDPLEYGLDKKGYLTTPPKLLGTGSNGSAVLKWNGTPDSVSTSFIFNSNADGVCRYLVKEYKESRTEIQLRNSDFKSDSARSMDVSAGKTFSISLKNLSPNRKYVLFLQAEDENYGVVNSYVDLSAASAGRPTATPTPTKGPTATPVPVRPAVKVTECSVEGLDGELEFYPYYMYRFTVTGAGTGNSSPQEGDVKWCPFTFATNPNYTPNDNDFSAQDEADSKEFEIGNSKGILHAQDYTMYIWFRKYVYTNGSWQRQGYKDRVAVSFRSAELDPEKFYAKLSGTPVPDDDLGENGYDAQDYGDLGGSGTDPEGGDEGGTNGADASNHSGSGSSTGTTKSNGARTADETPLGTLLMLLSASVLAGGYTLVRKRKKD